MDLGKRRLRIREDKAAMHDPAPLIVTTFEGLHEITEHAEAPLWNDPRLRGSRFKRDEMFNQVSHFEEAAKLARFGWQDGANRLYKMREAVKSRIDLPFSDFRPEYAVAGDVVDMGRFVTGEPEHMMRMPIDYTEKRQIIFTVDTNVSCRACNYRACGNHPVRETAMFYRGAAVSAVVESLERLGYAVGVKVQAATMHQMPDGNPRSWIREGDRFESVAFLNEMWLKKPGEFLDAPRLIFALGHANFMHSLEFGASEKQQFDHGVPIYVHKNEHPDKVGRMYPLGRFYVGQIAVVPDDLQGDVHVPSLHTVNFTNEWMSVKWALDTLKEQGVEVKEAA